MDKSISTDKVYSEFIREELSFGPLIRFWEKQSTVVKSTGAAFEYISEKLKNAPELREPITDLSLIEKHRELIEELLSICISPAIYNFDAYAAIFPDRHESFYETPGFKKLKLFKHDINSSCFNENCCLIPDGRIISGYMILLKEFDGLNVSYEYPLIYTLIDEKTGLERHYRIRIFGWFCDIKNKDEIEPLTESQKKIIFENLDNPQILMEIIPPHLFELEGFFLFNAVDITDLETLSSLKFDLIGKESILSPQKFESMQHKLRVLLRKPDIKLGLIAFPSEHKDMNNAIKMGNSIILQESFASKNIATKCKIYDEVLANKVNRLIYDTKDYGCSQVVEQAFVEKDIRNLLVAPLIYKDEVIGILELASSEPGELNKVNIIKLAEVYPLFALCIESSLDDLNKSIQSVIKEKCTAIHPTVEWRFRDAAYRYINNLRNNIHEEMEDIVFEDVHPFYGCSDVKNSSAYRNAAIQSDLLENLNIAKEIISKAAPGSVMPVIDELSFRISNQIEQLKAGLNSTNEIEIINFIRNEIGANFGFLKELSPELAELVNQYQKKLHPGLGFVYNKRKEFEDSIQIINDAISSELDIQQEKAQKIFPHYFEKYKTDGVEYNMYLGSSLSAEKKFNPMHGRSLKIWQLITMCLIAKKCSQLKDSLTIPLEITHLIFVHNNPITIKFFYDEKKFDVADSYDIRHEIIKKRIDKAEIKGTHERLTKPSSIAIVYSQESEAEEYKQYIDFLKTKNYVSGETELLELKELQGVSGLKAIRFNVNVKTENENNVFVKNKELNLKSDSEKFVESVKN